MISIAAVEKSNAKPAMIIKYNTNLLKDCRGLVSFNTHLLK
jgi:hypothetical protein